ncbi:HK97 family phage prohead protease [Sinorhizobium meliloti]|uniref:HK97 family phage prohead protease n=1 Tax=Rhizobium meliloti TaxID=382 RepID=UPI000FD95C80|nr:HK97 family phage prohead protease [Sinorhizobium meliloti]RVK64202.1 HK97 family phage prohead protease [Sinorhizobium meliloti]
MAVAISATAALCDLVEPMLKFTSETRFAAPIGLELKSEANGIVQGFAATFDGEPDRQGDIIRKGAFARTLREIAAEGVTVPMLWAHRQEQPVGRWTRLVETEKGLWATGHLSLQTDGGRQAREHLVAGDIDGLSIGFVLAGDGRRYLGNGTFEIRELELCEISLVAVPAQRRARISNVKRFETKADLVDALHRGEPLPRRLAAKVAAGGWNALTEANHDKANALIATIDAATARIRSELP